MCREAEALADLVLEVPREREVHALRRIDEEDERRRLTARLRDVTEAHLAPAIRCRRVSRDRLGQHLVQLRRGHALLPLIHDRERVLESRLHVPAGLRGHEMVPHPRREVEFADDLGQGVRGHLLTTVYHVPLVHGQHQADRGLERVPGDMRVLRGDAFGPVGQEDGDIGPFERMRGS